MRGRESIRAPLLAELRLPLSVCVSSMPPSRPISLFFSVAPFHVSHATNAPAITDLEHWQLLRLRHEHYGSLRNAKVIRDIFDRQCLRLLCRHIFSSLARAVLRVSDAAPSCEATQELQANYTRALIASECTGQHACSVVLLCAPKQRHARGRALCSAVLHLDACAGRVSESHAARDTRHGSFARALAQAGPVLY